jgi:phosphatidylglycerophosphatase A
MMQRLIRLFLTVLGIGSLPFAPGTWGSIPGLLLCGIWVRHFWALPLLFCLSYLAINKYPLENEDPRWVVIDEVIGMGAACVLYFQYYRCYHWLGLLLLFCFFRLFDIIKPFPIDWIERQLRHFNIPLSILVDDVVAGIFAGLATIFVMPPMLHCFCC